MKSQWLKLHGKLTWFNPISCKKWLQGCGNCSDEGMTAISGDGSIREAHLATVYLSRKPCRWCDTWKVWGMSCSPHKYQFQIQNTRTVSGWSRCFTRRWEPLNLPWAYLQDLKITSQIPGGTVINHSDTTELNFIPEHGVFWLKACCL